MIDQDYEYMSNQEFNEAVEVVIQESSEHIEANQASQS